MPERRDTRAGVRHRRALCSALLALLIGAALVPLGAGWAAARSTAPKANQALSTKSKKKPGRRAGRIGLSFHQSLLACRTARNRRPCDAIAPRGTVAPASTVQTPSKATAPGPSAGPRLPTSPANTTDKGCFSSPHSCGYPDETNTGVPPGTTLTNSGSITATTNGQVIDAKNITGSVTVAANNVTIQNSKITATAAGNGAFAVTIQGGRTGTVIKDTTIAGRGTGESTLESAVRNLAGPDALALRTQFTNCSDCWEGEGTFRDTYMLIDSIYAGAHAENIYVCSGKVDVDHSTLINEVNQTATVFGDTICGGGNDYTVTNSLLSGGGYIFYPQANNTDPGGPAGAKTVVTGNRIARCLGKIETKENGHWLCKGGADSNGLYPYGGSYSVGAYFSGPLTWSGNVWDDNLATISDP